MGFGVTFSSFVDFKTCGSCRVKELLLGALMVSVSTGGGGALLIVC